MSLLSGCSLETQGVFKTDSEMRHFFLEHRDAFYTLSENREICNEPSNDKTTSDYPKFCKDLKSELEVLSIDYWQHKNMNGDFKESLHLPIYYMDRVSFWNDYRKGYYYNPGHVDPSLILTGDLDRKPDKDDCYSLFGLVEIDEESTNNGWYIYVDSFCD